MADDIDDDNDLDQPVAAADKPAPATVLIEEVITAAIPAHVRRRMTQKGKGYALLLVVPDADWGRACAHLLSGAKGGGVQCRTFLEVPKNKSHQQDPAMIRALSKGQRLVLISPNPAAMIPDVVRRAADDVVTIGTAPVEVMRKAIRRITGRIVRGLQLADYAELDFDLLVSCLRPEDRPADIIRRLRELSATPQGPDVQVPAGPLLTQLPLTNTVRAWSDQMLQELAAVKRGTLDPAVLIYGALEGPPGTGKSLIARSLAATAGWNFVSSSVGAWFTTGDGALGGVARNVKAFVDTILALHELGHAIVAAELGHTVDRISILAGIGTGGATSTRLVSVVPTLAHLHNLVTIALGGRAADIVLGTGANAGAETDLAQATELLLAARLRQGLGDTLAAMPAVAAPALMKEVDADLKRLLARAMAIIQKYRAHMLRLADQLLDERIMTGDAVLGAVRSRKTRKRPRPSGMEAGECGSGAGPAP